MFAVGSSASSRKVYCELACFIPAQETFPWCLLRIVLCWVPTMSLGLAATVQVSSTLSCCGAGSAHEIAALQARVPLCSLHPYAFHSINGDGIWLCALISMHFKMEQYFLA